MDYKNIRSLVLEEGGVPGEFRGECTPDACDIMVVGEAPGPDEAEAGRPFIGRAGKLLAALLTECGIEDYYITNTVKHFPGRDAKFKIRAPSKEEVLKWSKVLEWELELIKPKAVLLLGIPACKTVFGGQWSMGKLAGSKIEKDGVTYYAAFHPASFLYNQGTAANTRNMNTFRRTLREIVGGEQREDYAYEVLPPNIYEGSLIIDIETPGDTDPRTAKITEWTILPFDKTPVV